MHGPSPMDKVQSAISRNNLEELKELKRQGIDISELVDSHGASPLHLAARRDRVSILEFLVGAAGCSAAVRTPGACAAPSHDAAATGSLDALRWLLENTDTQASLEDGGGCTVLHLAARFGHSAAVRWLVTQHGVPACVRSGVSGALPLHFAAESGNLDIVKFLVEHGSAGFVSVPLAGSGATPLYLAAQDGHLEVLQYLVEEAGASPRVVATEDGMSCLHTAAQNAHTHVLAYLVERCHVSVNERTFEGGTPLHYAAAQGHANVVRWLLDRGAAIAMDNLGATALHEAAQAAHMHVCRVLLDSGADVNITDNEGRTAAALADVCGNSHCADLIREHQAKGHDPHSGAYVSVISLAGRGPSHCNDQFSANSHSSSINTHSIHTSPHCLSPVDFSSSPMTDSLLVSSLQSNVSTYSQYLNTNQSNQNVEYPPLPVATITSVHVNGKDNDEQDLSDYACSECSSAVHGTSCRQLHTDEPKSYIVTSFQPQNRKNSSAVESQTNQLNGPAYSSSVIVENASHTFVSHLKMPVVSPNVSVETKSIGLQVSDDLFPSVLSSLPPPPPPPPAPPPPPLISGANLSSNHQYPAGHVSLPGAAKTHGSNILADIELKSKSLNRTAGKQSKNNESKLSTSNSSLNFIEELKSVSNRQMTLRKVKKPEAVKKFYGSPVLSQKLLVNNVKNGFASTCIMDSHVENNTDKSSEMDNTASIKRETVPRCDLECDRNSSTRQMKDGDVTKQEKIATKSIGVVDLNEEQQTRNNGQRSPAVESLDAKENGVEKSPFKGNKPLGGATVRLVLRPEFQPSAFLSETPAQDAAGAPIPQWKRLLVARGLAEAAQRKADAAAQEAETEARFAGMPPWKRALIEKREGR